MTQRTFSVTAHLRIDGRRLRRILNLLSRSRHVIVTVAAWLVIGWAFQLTVPLEAAGQINGLSVVHGKGTITGSGTADITIQQQTAKLIAHANQFDIIQGQTVQVLQPVGAAALIRVFDNKASTINGNLFASSLLFLLNPNGVLFGPAAQVNGGGTGTADGWPSAGLVAGAVCIGAGGPWSSVEDSAALVEVIATVNTLTAARVTEQRTERLLTV